MKYDPWEDEEVQQEFVYKNSNDFLDWVNEKGYNIGIIAGSEKLALSYCEANIGYFLDFAANYEEEMQWAEGDQINDLKGNK